MIGKATNPPNPDLIATSMKEAGADFMFIGKGGLVLLGYSGSTLDIDITAALGEVNARKLIQAVKLMGFNLDEAMERKLLTGVDFIQLQDGPFLFDIVFAPDGIKSFEDAKSRCVVEGPYIVMNPRDILASKVAANRPKDLVDIPLIKLFIREYEKAHAAELLSAHETALKNTAARQVKEQ